MTEYSLVSDFREMPVWYEARTLAVVGHDLAERLQHQFHAKGSSQALRNLCIDVLTSLVNQFDGNPEALPNVKPLSAFDALARLEALLSEFIDQGQITHLDYELLNGEIQKVKELL